MFYIGISMFYEGINLFSTVYYIQELVFLWVVNLLFSLIHPSHNENNQTQNQAAHHILVDKNLMGMEMLERLYPSSSRLAW